MRGITPVLIGLVILSVVWICYMRFAGAENVAEGSINQVLANQQKILQKLQEMDGKLDILKVRVR